MSEEELADMVTKINNDPPEGMREETNGGGAGKGQQSEEEEIDSKVKMMVLQMLQTDVELQTTLLRELVPNSRSDLLSHCQSSLERFVQVCSSELQLMHWRCGLSDPNSLLSSSLDIVRYSFPSARSLSLWFPKSSPSPRSPLPSPSSSSSSSSSLSVATEMTDAERDRETGFLVEIFEREEKDGEEGKGGATGIASIIHNPQRSDVLQLESLLDRYEAENGFRPPFYLLSSFVSDSVALSLDQLGFKLLLIQ